MYHFSPENFKIDLGDSQVIFFIIILKIDMTFKLKVITKEEEGMPVEGGVREKIVFLTIILI